MQGSFVAFELQGQVGQRTPLWEDHGHEGLLVTLGVDAGVQLGVQTFVQVVDGGGRDLAQAVAREGTQDLLHVATLPHSLVVVHLLLDAQLVPHH